MQIRLMGGTLFHDDRRTVMAKAGVASREFVNTPENTQIRCANKLRIFCMFLAGYDTECEETFRSPCRYIQGISGGIVNILGGGNMDFRRRQWQTTPVQLNLPRKSSGGSPGV